MPQNPNQGPWIIAGAILLAAVVVVTAMIYLRSKDAACANWQAEVQEAAESPLALGEMNVAAALVDTERPNGCPFP